MWIAIRPFNYRGKRYSAGDTVPAESWSVRRFMEARRRIRFVSPISDSLSNSQLKSMTRAELNFLATQRGIVDAESYPNRDSLISRINGDEDSTEESVEDDESTNQDPDVTEEDDSEEVIELNDPVVEDPESEDEFEDDSDDESKDDSEDE